MEEERKNVQGFGGKARRKDTTRKIRIDLMEINWGCGVVSTGSG
jgi:hypothetical protein